MKRKLLLSLLAVLIAVAVGTAQRIVLASDHDDGSVNRQEHNLTDHYAFVPGDYSDSLAIITYFNPRSMPGEQYSMSDKARYEMHVSRASCTTATPTTADDVVFRFEATGPLDENNVQKVKFSVYVDGKKVGEHMGETTPIAKSKVNDNTVNVAIIGGQTYRYFIGMRADGFQFDVLRYFQVRAYLAQRFFGGPNGLGDASADLADNCRGDKFLANLKPGGVAANEKGGVSDGDVINLWNPDSCAPDFTKNFNVISIALVTPIKALQSKDGGETVFDSWSTISVPKDLAYLGTP
jgi:hypothetical protein